MKITDVPPFMAAHLEGEEPGVYRAEPKAIAPTESQANEIAKLAGGTLVVVQNPQGYVIVELGTRVAICPGMPTAHTVAEALNKLQP